MLLAERMFRPEASFGIEYLCATWQVFCGHTHALLVSVGDDVAIAHGGDGDHGPVERRHVPANFDLK